ncbi:methylenetetrahydrofolate reductase [NAD(P)H] [uncultured Ruminococcus sp.]|uniref:methylenetetrahydrofolate reductase [NAD(P)H] n=1 Tax=uncultured Ruminococcus sp. TaxID=165186 RepID=UPI0025D222A3|nr:methylenetetrahydrofolate reductase [NAD(P)H] [uncultured Ruminococcus sp.]
MKTNELFKQKTTLSFEVFPPKSDTPIESIYSTIEGLASLNPDFISVTYGAGGSGSNATIGICEMIKEKYNVEPVAHLACINLTREKVIFELAQMRAAGIENILALRGDINPNIPPHNDFRYASELIGLIKEQGDFNIIGACYPETHPEAASSVEDIRHLKEKVDAGCSQLISQLFFDNEDFYAFREKAAIAGINVPIEAGIMPVTNPKTIARMASLCHAKLPKKFLTIMSKYENDPIAMRDAGIAYAVSQIVDLIANDVDGIHLYTMNNPYIATKICESVQSLFK